MYKISLVGPNAPSMLSIGTISLSRGQHREVAYLTSDMIDAYNRLYITIEPSPVSLEMTAQIVNNQSGGVNLGLVVPRVIDIATAASAIAVLADNQNRIVSDLSRVVSCASNLESDMRQALSILSKVS